MYACYADVLDAFHLVAVELGRECCFFSHRLIARTGGDYTNGRLWSDSVLLNEVGETGFFRVGHLRYRSLQQLMCFRLYSCSQHVVAVLPDCVERRHDLIWSLEFSVDDFRCARATFSIVIDGGRVLCARKRVLQASDRLLK